MVTGDAQWLATIDAFHSAALGELSWEAALARFAQATGSRSAQLVGHHSNTSVVFNVWTNMDPALYATHADTVSINPRVKLAEVVPVLRIVSDMDFITTEQMRRDTFYQEYLYPFDIPFICLTPVEKSNGAVVALGAIRSRREGHISREQREIFASLAPHVRSAVRTHLALEGQSTAVLMGAMDALTMSVFVCDRSGRVRSLTPSAEALVSSDRGLQLKAGQLTPYAPADAKALGDAIDAAAIGLARMGPPATRTVIIRGRDPDLAPLVLDVFPLASRSVGFNFDPRVLIVARGSRGSTRRAAVLQAAYALTPAEIRIAQLLAEGQSAELIAARRGVAVGTVRAQIKTIMAKVGVRRQVELVVRLTEL
jgi:DNA-binding CsgD family transcriptional regulator